MCEGSGEEEVHIGREIERESVKGKGKYVENIKRTGLRETKREKEKYKETDMIGGRWRMNGMDRK